MTKEEEKAIFDRATEKLDLYVPLLLKHNYVDAAREFLQPGGAYVRFAVKEFMKELIFELIKPVGEWTRDPYYIDMDPIYETVKRELVPCLKETSDGCRAAVGKALDEALEQLVEFKALLQALKSCC